MFCHKMSQKCHRTVIVTGHDGDNNNPVMKIPLATVDEEEVPIGL